MSPPIPPIGPLHPVPTAAQASRTLLCVSMDSAYTHLFLVMGEITEHLHVSKDN